MKIQALDEKTILIENAIRIHIAEDLHGHYNITIEDTEYHRVRLGIPFEKGTHFQFWKDIKEFLRKSK